MKEFVKLLLLQAIKLLPKKRWAIILGLILGYIVASLDQIIQLIQSICGVAQC